jgi:hypothetical protein
VSFGSHFLLAYVSMGMESSTISVFSLLFDSDISAPASIVVLEELNSLGTDLQILLRQIDFGYFLMTAARRIVLAIVSPATTSSIMMIHTLDSPTMLIGYFFSWHACVGTLADVD